MLWRFSSPVGEKRLKISLHTTYINYPVYMFSSPIGEKRLKIMIESYLFGGTFVFVPYRGKEIKNRRQKMNNDIKIVFVPYRGKEIKNLLQYKPLQV